MNTIDDDGLAGLSGEIIAAVCEKREVLTEFGSVASKSIATRARFEQKSALQTRCVLTKHRFSVELHYADARTGHRTRWIYAVRRSEEIDKQPVPPRLGESDFYGPSFPGWPNQPAPECIEADVRSVAMVA